jgi:predicted enzyme related to lactoylglutathione lyase
MTVFNKYEPGTFCWVDLVTTDIAAAKKFYGDLFGWTLVDTPAGPDMFYTMAMLDGKEVAGLYERGPQQQDVPPHWMSYVSVANADEAAAKAKSLGGTVVMEAMDVMTAGRMAMIQDPTGAMMGLWQPKEHIGGRLANIPDSLCWNELATRDAKTAGEFYTKLFGWNSEVAQFGPTEYTSFSVGERANAGMMEMTADWPADVPPHWLVYFAVADCEASTEQAKSLGATIIMPPTDAGETGRFSVIQDPQGAVFSIIKMNVTPD